MFDPLRNDPRFEKLVASTVPKAAENAPLKRGNSDCQESFCRVEAVQGCTAAEIHSQTPEGFFS